MPASEQADDDVVAVRVVADDAGEGDGEGRAEPGEVDGKVEPRAAGADRELLDDRDVVQRRVVVDDLADVDDDRPGAQHAAAGAGSGLGAGSPWPTSGCSLLAERALGDLEVGLERAVRLQADVAERVVVGAHAVLG